MVENKPSHCTMQRTSADPSTWQWTTCPILEQSCRDWFGLNRKVDQRRVVPVLGHCSSAFALDRGSGQVGRNRQHCLWRWSRRGLGLQCSTHRCGRNSCKGNRFLWYIGFSGICKQHVESNSSLKNCHTGIWDEFNLILSSERQFFLGCVHIGNIFISRILQDFKKY